MGKIRNYLLEFKTIWKNVLYNLSYQILSILYPIITVPYVSRVFSQEIIGYNAVIQANCSYFTLVGMLGIAVLGPREIAKCQWDKDMLSHKFSKIYSVQFLSHLFALFIYLFICIIFCKNAIVFVYIIYIVASMFDVSWFFIGIEKFKTIAVRNIFIKAVSIVFLFVVVHSNKDIYVYILTLYVPQIIMNGHMWRILLKKYIKYVKFMPDINTIKESLSLFVPQIASTIYTVLDKTILGFFVTYDIVAIYTQGQTILRLILSVVPSFSRVMLPRMSSSIQKGNRDEIEKYMKLSANIIFCVSILLFFQTIIMAQPFVEWYLPENYKETASVLILCAPIIIAIGGANLISVEYLIPSGKQSKYTISIIISSVLNISLNFILAPTLGVYGICIGSIVAEWTGFIIQLFFVRKELSIKRLFVNLPVYLCSAFVITILEWCWISYGGDSNIFLLALIAIGSIILYFLLTFFLIKIKKRIYKIDNRELDVIRKT